jgi:hypothetical protein
MPDGSSEKSPTRIRDSPIHSAFYDFTDCGHVSIVNHFPEHKGAEETGYYEWEIMNTQHLVRADT